MKKATMLITALIIFSAIALSQPEEYDLTDPDLDYSDIPESQWAILDQSKVPADRIREIPASAVNVNQVDRQNLDQLTDAQWAYGDNLQQCPDLTEYPEAQEGLRQRFPGITSLSLEEGNVRFDGTHLQNGGYTLPISAQELAELGASVASVGAEWFRVSAPYVVFNELGFSFEDSPGGYLVLGEGMGYAHVPQGENIHFAADDRFLRIGPAAGSPVEGIDFIFDPETGAYVDISGDADYSSGDISGSVRTSAELLERYAERFGYEIDSEELLAEALKDIARGVGAEETGEAVPPQVRYFTEMPGARAPRLRIPKVPEEERAEFNVDVFSGVGWLNLEAPRVGIEVEARADGPLNPRIKVTAGVGLTESIGVGAVAEGGIYGLPEMSVTLSHTTPDYLLAVQASNSPFWNGKGVSNAMEEQLQNVYGLQLYLEVPTD